MADVDLALNQQTETVFGRLRFATALRKTFQDGYNLDRFRHDLVAGLVVGVVALPLSMALAIACGMPPQHGLYTAIVAGFVTAMLGGSFTSVSGPTAAFVVLLVPVTSKYGPGGLLLASLMAGVLLVFMGMARLGRLLEFVPHPVTTGFTAGIAVVIATLQIKDLMGLSLSHAPEHYVDRIAALFQAMPTLQWQELTIGLFTLVVLILWRYVNRRVPAALVAIVLASLLAWGLVWGNPNLTVRTIGNQFSYVVGGTAYPGIPQTPPKWVLPWTMLRSGAQGEPVPLSLDMLRTLAIPAIAIALLGAIESLLCAVVADGIVGTRHDSDAELISQGIGNIVAPFFGGFAATGAVARTAANIQAGGRSPIASMAHAVFILASMLILAPLLSYIPMASLAALLLLVAWNMSDAKHFIRTVRIAPRGDVLVLLACFGLTVIFDMVVAVTAGVILAALIFMRRMAELTDMRLTEGEHPHLSRPLPPNTLLYEIAGPLFFGAAEKAVSALSQARMQKGGWVVLYFSQVPHIDLTGLVALQSAIKMLRAAGMRVVLAGVQRQPAALIRRAGIREEPGALHISPTLEDAVALIDPVPAFAP